MGEIMLICLTALVSMGMGLIIGWYFTGHKYCIQLYRYKSISEKYLLFIRLYDVWMVNDAENHTIDQYLLERGIDSIAIYGMSHLGVRLYQRLRHNEVIKVEYALDQNPQVQLPDLEIYCPGKEERRVDTVIVTALYAFDSIKRTLLENGYQKVLSLDEILYDMLAEIDNK